LTAGAYSTEAAWVDGGGGYSLFEQEPSYQASVQTSGVRSTPDVAFDADPNTGVEVYETAPGARSGSWQVVGGTSLGSPSWAGIIAIADQGRALAGVGSLDGPTQTLPTLYAAASRDFNSVSATPTYGGFSFGGFNPFEEFSGSGGFWGAFGSGLGLHSTGTSPIGETANTATGLGTPKGSALISDLVGSTLTQTLTFIGASSGSTGTGTMPTAPTAPTKPAKHHAKHGHVATKHKAHVAKLTHRKLVNQAHTSATHVSGIRLG
jgi:subtilase family serine protease